ncbi:MAG: hypothetical protein QOK41_1788 [Sphingomonadales bacterium]|jgi:hypothetical protein|nr:hypothetical protein [Sphingomonadales bacterium]
MWKQCLAALLSACALPAQSQAAVPAIPIQPSVDTPEQRQALRKFTVCLAEARPGWARATLAYPYLSDAQAKAAAEALRGRDNCLGTSEKEMTFRTSTLVAALAEHFVRAEIRTTDGKRLGSALATVTPLNVSEDFALCVAARDVGAATDLALSEPGSAAENTAVSEVGVYVPSCAKPGEKLNVDVQSLRALVTNALYRGVTAAARSRN